ncbi:MAG: hypothetical protein IKI63_05210 [Clostridia bacterium]|nr:hypothetical protein [Clostridia bacterium]
MKHLNTIKRIGATLLGLTLLMSLFAISAAAELSATVLVTIADENGALALASEPVIVNDTDADGVLTIHDALYCAHEAYYEGGAAAGYASVQSEYGLSLTKLWGAENGGSYGYYVNDASAMSLSDPIADGDRVNAFVYTDLTAWSDTYCYFDVTELSGEVGDVTLTLSAASFDENWAPIVVPVVGATLTINGEKTDAVTDENGCATITLPGTGAVVISAVSDTQTLVPPVCVTRMEAVEEISEEDESDAGDEPSWVEEVLYETDSADAPTAPATGDAGSTVAGIALFGALCAAGLTVACKRREK